MEVCKNVGYPQIIHFRLRLFPINHPFLGYPHFRNPQKISLIYGGATTIVHPAKSTSLFGAPPCTCHQYILGMVLQPSPNARFIFGLKCYIYTCIQYIAAIYPFISDYGWLYISIVLDQLNAWGIKSYLITIFSHGIKPQYVGQLQLITSNSHQGWCITLMNYCHIS